MEIQIRIKSENEYFCVLILVCLSVTIIVEKENETKTCKRSFYLQSTNSTCRIFSCRQWSYRSWTVRKTENMGIEVHFFFIFPFNWLEDLVVRIFSARKAQTQQYSLKSLKIHIFIKELSSGLIFSAKSHASRRMKSNVSIGEVRPTYT